MPRWAALALEKRQGQVRAFRACGEVDQAGFQGPPDVAGELAIRQLLDIRLHQAKQGCVDLLVAERLEEAAALLEQCGARAGCNRLVDIRRAPLPARIEHACVELRRLTTPVRVPDFLDELGSYRGSNPARPLAQASQNRVVRAGSAATRIFPQDDLGPVRAPICQRLPVGIVRLIEQAPHHGHDVLVDHNGPP